MGKRILVIDDDAAFAEMLEVALGARGYEVECCLQSPMAFQKIKAYLPDLVTLDIMMPGRSGWEIANQMRASPKTARIPVLITTGAQGGLMADEALLLQGMQYAKLYKPFELDDLYRKVEQLIGPSTREAGESG